MRTLFNIRTFWVGLGAIGASGLLYAAGLCRAGTALGLGLAGLLVLPLAWGLAGAREAAR